MSEGNGQAPDTPGIEGIGHISLTVSELSVSVEWYQRVLGLTKMMDEVHPGGRVRGWGPVRLQLGILLAAFRALLIAARVVW